MSALGSKADIGARPINVRFTPKSGHRNSVVQCLLCAMSGLMQCSKKHIHSIISSARIMSDSGTLSANALVESTDQM